MSELKSFQKTFIDLALQSNALEFGKFILKSGRESPYFFNAAKMLNGCDLFSLANCYLEAIEDSNIEFDCMYGPAYKGISLASALSAFLASNHKEETYFIYDRKDQKLHGEKGDIVGTFQDGNTIIIDDVITAGTAMKNTLIKLEKYNLNINSLLVLLDRQEKGSEDVSASDEIKKNFNIDVYSLISISDIIDFVTNTKEFEKFKSSIIEYKEKYGS